MVSERRKIVAEFLSRHSVLSLATSADGMPHAAAVFYVNVDWTLYFLSSPSSRHSENISKNNRVAGTINGVHDDWRAIRGIQLAGKAGEAGGILANAPLVRAYVEKFPSVKDMLLSPGTLAPAIRKKIAGVRFFGIDVHWVRFIDNAFGFGNREEFYLT